MAKMPNITEADIKDPVLLARYLRQLQTVINRLESQIGANAAEPSQAEQTVINNITQKIEQKITGGSGSASLTAIRDALQATGSTPLNVQNLRGILTDPQPAGVEIFSEMPSATQLQAMQPDTLFIVEDATTGVNTLYYVGDGSPHTAEELTTLPSNVVLTDTPQDIGPGASKVFKDPTTFDSPTADAIKLQPRSAPAAGTQMFRILNSTGTVLGYFDIDGDMEILRSLGIGGPVDSTAITLQVNHASNAILRCEAASVNGNATQQFANATQAWQFYLEGASGSFHIRDATSGTNRLSITNAGVITFNGSVVGGTSTWSGLMTFTRNGAHILSKPAGATAANTRIYEQQKSVADGGATTAIVDYEGDAQFNTLTIPGTASISGLLSAIGGFSLGAGGLFLNKTSTSAAVYAVAATDLIINTTRTATGPCTIDLPAVPTNFRLLVINDSGNNAHVNNISINGNGPNIRGQVAGAYVSGGSISVVTQGTSIGLFYDNTEWRVLWYN
jgi:hypothetical protein